MVEKTKSSRSKNSRIPRDSNENPIRDLNQMREQSRNIRIAINGTN